MKGWITGVVVVFLGWLSVNPGHSQNTLFPDTLRYCYTDSLRLDAGPEFDSVVWSTGTTAPSVWIKETGDYYVSVWIADTLSFIDYFFVLIHGGSLPLKDTLVTCGDTITLYTSGGGFDYFWIEPDTLADSVRVWPRMPETYHVTITHPDSAGWYYCIDSTVIDVDPGIVIDSVQQLSIGCPGEDKAKIKLEVSGGYPPYDYDWPAEAIPLFEDPSFAIGLTDGEKDITITDSLGCTLNDKFKVKAHRIPELTLNADPSDTVYLQKPYVTFTFENPEYDSLGVDTLYINWWEWNFGDSTSSVQLSPTHTYQNTGTYQAVLKFRTFYECEGTDTLNIEVKPVKLKISTVFTPNGDPQNEYFEIWEDTGDGEGSTAFKSITGSDSNFDLKDFYIRTHLKVFNRWGEVVFETDDYQNDWNGNGLPDGVYYYLLQCEGEFSKDVYKGSVMILTGSPF
ncbi:MAG: hypothetical protein Kow00127_10440 [Bacteroidales bacterium]